MPLESIDRGYPLYLAGDIGGTKTLLALYMQKEAELISICIKRLPSQDWQDLRLLLEGFLQEVGIKPEEITGGCLSLAGPIIQDRCLLTNLNRVIDIQSLRSSLNLQNPLLFANDLEAMGHGLKFLQDEELLCLNPSAKNPSSSPFSSSSLTLSSALSKPSLNRALIAPGTGLGQAMILADGRVCATEGAHGDYAPATEQEIRLWRFLAQKYGHVSYERVLSGPGHVSYERVLSGPGLVNIYEFLLEEIHPHSFHDPFPTPAEITKKALNEICPLCTEALELFVKILGAEAGNLALRTLAYGGVYLGGGIPHKILPKLQEDSFMEAFLSKGRLRDLLSQIPIYVILNERTPLLGAASLAAAAEYPLTLAAIDDVNNNRNMSKAFDSVSALMEDLNA